MGGSSASSENAAGCSHLCSSAQMLTSHPPGSLAGVPRRRLHTCFGHNAEFRAVSGVSRYELSNLSQLQAATNAQVFTCSAPHALPPPLQVNAQERKNPRRQQQQQQHSSRGACLLEEWPGLAHWRSSGVDQRLHWGEAQAVVGEIPFSSGVLHQQGRSTAQQLPASLFQAGVQVLSTACPYRKVALTHAAWAAYQTGALPLRPHASSHAALEAMQLPERPSRPEKPKLVHAREVPSISTSPLPLNAHVLHNLAHIELNAIDLAWDTCVRFASLHLPVSFYTDFARSVLLPTLLHLASVAVEDSPPRSRVADDEARHFGWVAQRLAEIGAAYGDMVAHDVLWQGCHLSSGELSARLAVVPMGQEARGLDAGHKLAKRLVGFGDNRSAAIVARIAEEEQAHVAIGVSWFRNMCHACGSSPQELFRQRVVELCPELLRGPFNHAARHAVGLPRAWYDTTLWPAGIHTSTDGTPSVASAQNTHSSESWNHSKAGSSTEGHAEQAPPLTAATCSMGNQPMFGAAEHLHSLPLSDAASLPDSQTAKAVPSLMSGSLEAQAEQEGCNRTGISAGDSNPLSAADLEDLRSVSMQVLVPPEHLIHALQLRLVSTAIAG